MEQLHHYVCGYTVTVKTEHKPLVSIWKKIIISASLRLQHLQLRLLQYDIDFAYLKGKSKFTTDPLPRVSTLKADRPKQSTDEEDKIIPLHHITEKVPTAEDRLNLFYYATHEDRVPSLLMHNVYQGKPVYIKLSSTAT